jgi:hypothetical protein
MTDNEYESRLRLQDEAEASMREWKSANAEAIQAERRLTRLWTEFEEGRGGPPSVDVLFEVNRVRAWANYRLVDAMLHLRALACPE